MSITHEIANTERSCYYSTVGIRDDIQYVQIIAIYSIYLFSLVMAGILKLNCYKQYIVILEFIITRVYCDTRTQYPPSQCIAINKHDEQTR